MNTFFVKLFTPFLILFAGFSPQPLSPIQSSTNLDVKHLQTTIEEHDHRLQTLESTQNNLSASLVIPTSVALFEQSLATKISSSATSMTLVSATDKTGTALASSTYAFIIDEGTALEEMVVADCTSTVCTNMIRGLSIISGTTSVATLAFSHGRGASVKITDGPQLLILSRIINGIATFPNLLAYTSGTACSGSSSNSAICDKAYVDGVGSSGAANANTTTKGIVEIATPVEIASSTVLGSTGATTVVPSSQATSTYNPSGSLQVVVTQNNNKIHNQFIATSSTDIYRWAGSDTYSGNNTFTGITTLATSSQATTTVQDLRNNYGVSYGGKITVMTTPVTWGSSDTATTTILTFNLPANTLATSSALHMKFYVSGTSFQAGNFGYEINYGGGKVYKTVVLTSNPNPASGYIDMVLIGKGTTNSQYGVISMELAKNGIGVTALTASDVTSATLSVNSQSNQTVTISGKFLTSDASNVINVDGGYVEIIN